MKPGIALIGPGKVGCAVTQRLYQAGYPIRAVISRKLEKATDACRFIGCAAKRASTDLKQAGQAEIILLAVPDDQIDHLASELRNVARLSAENILIHFSGLQPADCMRADHSPVATLSIHPLLPFADRQIASQRLTGCPCALEGDEQCISLATELVKAFGGRPFHIAAEDKVRYHAGACIASNFLVTLLATASDVLTECKISRDEALALLLPLVQASLDNTAQLGAEQGLTGPIVRGDIGTVKKHLFALEKTPQILDFYQRLGIQTIELAKKSSHFPHEKAVQLQSLFHLDEKY